ncbi:hypothetical protein EVAR_53935_1 [Eumeta japonica]|uniref:Uncharacterized protein n=1 Tax=Eumeta variegata TaxID=151549 RepID=A0A4C1ZFJ4_EUMVA|nr:hypothetical protein EVAR_53935_1 [Eumeta japonica]
MTDCRLQKRANVSLSLRLPRGRPPAVGVDNSIFRLTPPSAEAVTPTGDVRPATPAEPSRPDELNVDNGTESAAELTIKKEIESTTRNEIETPAEKETERFVRAQQPDYSPNPHAWTRASSVLLHAQPQLHGRMAVTPAPDASVARVCLLAASPRPAPHRTATPFRTIRRIRFLSTYRRALLPPYTVELARCIRISAGVDDVCPELRL